MKSCSTCSVLKSLEDFKIDRRNRDGRSSNCRSCAQAATDRWKADHPDAVAAHSRATYFKHHERRLAENAERALLARYGITQADYEIMLERQGGACAICKRPPGVKRLHVDHNHETGEVRGLLCLVCNMRLATLENLDWRVAAEAYLAQERVGV